MRRSRRYLFGIMMGCLVMMSGVATAHTRAGTVVLQGSLQFSSSNGELYSDENRTQLAFIPSVHYFIINRFALGGRMGIETVKQGDVSSTSFQLGPSAAYYFGEVDDNTVPYVGAGVFYRAISSKNRGSESDDSGSSIALFGGLAVFLRDHLAITPEASVVLESLGGNSGTTFRIGVGLAGFLY